MHACVCLRLCAYACLSMRWREDVVFGVLCMGACVCARYAVVLVCCMKVGRCAHVFVCVQNVRVLYP